MKNYFRNKFESFLFFKSYVGYKVYLQLILSVVISLLDSIGLSLFIPLLSKLDDTSKSSATNDSSDFLSNFEFLKEMNVANILALIVLFFCLKGFFIYFYNVYFAIVRRKLMTTVRKELIDGVDSVEYAAFSSTDLGKIQNTLTTDIGNVSAAYQSYFITLQQLLFILVYVVLSFWVDYQFAFFIIVGGILSNQFFNKLYRFTKEMSKKIVKNNSNFQGIVIQYISNYKYLKATNYNSKYVHQLYKHNNLIEYNNIKLTKVSAIVTAVREPSLILIISCTIFIQLYLLNGTLSAIILILMFFYRALGYVLSMQASYNSFLGVHGSLENVKEFGNFLYKNRERKLGDEFSHLKSELQFKNLNFSYDKNKIALKNINLTILKNTTIGIVGESGGGKTTFVNILCGLLKVGNNQFFIDGEDFNTFNLSQYRNKIGYITQESVIFNDTVFNNITFWAEKNQENLDRFWLACRQAKIDDVINLFHLKEDEVLGHSGINISGGQKQRISIARELYKKSEILILDEATSALDSESENYIKNNIDHLKGTLTTIIIAHRFSTIKNVDKIFLFKNGEIEDSGTFLELYQRSSTFKKMVDIQQL